MTAWIVISCLAVAGTALGPPAPAVTTHPQVGAPVPVQAAAEPAAEPRDPLLTLTLPDALRLGLSADRESLIRHYAAIAARASETAAAGTYQPQVSLDGSYRKFKSASTGFSTGAAGADQNHEISLSIAQLLFDNGQGLYDLYRTRQDAKAADSREQQTKLDAAGQIVRDFYAVTRAEALLRLSEQLLAQAEQQLAQAQARLDQKQGAELDVTRARVAATNARVDLAAAQNRTRVSYTALRSDLRLPPGTRLAISDAFPAPQVESKLADALSAALTERPAISAAEATARSRMHALTRARLNRFYDVRVTASYQRYLESSRDVNYEYVLGAAVSIPLWDGQSGRTSVVIAEQNYRQAQEQYLQTVEQTELEVEQTFVTWDDARQRLAAADEAVLLAADSLQRTEESFKLGVASLIDVTDARTEYARSESNRIEAQIDRDQAALLLRLAVGRFPAEAQAAKEPDGD